MHWCRFATPCTFNFPKIRNANSASKWLAVARKLGVMDTSKSIEQLVCSYYQDLSWIQECYCITDLLYEMLYGGHRMSLIPKQGHHFWGETSVCCATECPIKYNLDWTCFKRNYMNLRSCKSVKYSPRYTKIETRLSKWPPFLKMAAISKNGSPGRLTSALFKILMPNLMLVSPFER